ncbi:doublesex cognate 73A [Lasioglossum baleicum]|uniref:doublesex cognate 73A n=1 Tax=Lasioglossum baleicum TaxID=434251 RepID=UPI003FCD1CFD
MKPIGGLAWFVVLMAGTVALPSQSQTHHRGVQVKSKQTTPTYFGVDKSASFPAESNSSPVAKSASGRGSGNVNGNGNGNSNSNGNSIDVDFRTGTGNTGSDGNNGNDEIGDDTASRPVSFGVSATTAIDSPVIPISSSSPSSPSSSSPSLSYSMIPPISTGLNSFTETIDTVPTTSSPTSSNTGKSFEASTTTNSTTAAGGTAAPTNTNTASLETSSRTITPVQVAGEFTVLESKKLTTVFENFTTTPVSISAKETRESPGKIRPQIKLTTNYSSLSETGVRLPEGASAALAKPTKYHYYPHNQHIYLLPECAVQQVCNAVYVRLNFTQPLCACPGRYRDPCSASLDSDDLHTTELVTDPRTKALTLVKTCEPVAEMRECRTPRDWSLLALQNVRTGKSHYLVICRCPDANILEGPMSHDQPTYASVPGIRVYGMMCVQGNRKGRPLRYTRSISDRPNEDTGENPGRDEAEERLSFPWYKVQQLMDAAVWN